MKTEKFLFFLLVLGLIILSNATAQEQGLLTLNDCYTLALVRSESIGIQKELIKETEGLMKQSLSTALPRIAFAYSEKWQDVRPNDRLDGSVPEGKFTFTQPLFTGFKEFAAIRASKQIVRQHAATLKRALQLLFMDVSDAFYLYWGYQEDLKVQQEMQVILRDRVAELRKRESLGKSRASEVASAEAKLLKTEAGVEAIRGQVEVAGQLLEFLIGQPVDEVVNEPLSKEIEDLGVLAIRMSERPDIIAAQESLESYKNNITAARSSFFPTVALTGNSYTKRSGSNEGNDWDATVSVNVPLFNGMSDVGQVVQARAQVNAADLRLSQVRRKALLEVKSAYSKKVSSFKKLEALIKASAASEKNYRMQADDFKKSLVNNLEVLQSLEDLGNVKRECVAAQVEAGRSFWGLKVAAGEDLQ